MPIALDGIVCVFVFLPNEQNQCRRITRNVEYTPRPKYRTVAFTNFLMFSNRADHVKHKFIVCMIFGCNLSLYTREMYEILEIFC